MKCWISCRMSTVVKVFTLWKMDWRLENLRASDVDDRGVVGSSEGKNRTRGGETSLDTFHTVTPESETL